MILTLQRYSDNSESTLGLLFIEGTFQCYTLEDEARLKKVRGETRIPAGIYELKLREEVTPLTARYRSKLPWFDWHLELQDVPNFSNLYIHYGNHDDHTDGCLLVGNTVNNNRIGDGFVGNSVAAYDKLYKRIRPLIEKEKIYIHIIDEKK